ncbi:MAG TPA: DUF3820 family protein [Puia sp.]|nr:DUF3820 family protein [Puia sp.]
MVKFTDKTPIPFGKYKGTALANVPAATLLWYWDNITLSEPMKEYIRENLDALKAEAKRSSQFNRR